VARGWRAVPGCDAPRSLGRSASRDAKIDAPEASRATGDYAYYACAIARSGPRMGLARVYRAAYTRSAPVPVRYTT